ncbi:hypothetical protein KIW84_022756 [Lathyrus oleraceus]|uniref:Uncharacterized protein n=1 Tax=Pisum sativum TaxID=3888 RepID=A0A9D4YBZ4_PEA|nr:hypothetical protein KIW84_022756 [Pisum sativum]
MLLAWAILPTPPTKLQNYNLQTYGLLHSAYLYTVCFKLKALLVTSCMLWRKTSADFAGMIVIEANQRDKQISERTHTGKEENSLATTTKDQSSETLYQALDSEKDIQQRDFVQQMMDSLPGPSCEINRKFLFLESSLVLAKRPNSKKRLVSAGILSELCGNNIHQGPKVAFQDLRNEKP